jgi:hypothetical protein
MCVAVAVEEYNLCSLGIIGKYHILDSGSGAELPG